MLDSFKFLILYAFLALLMFFICWYPTENCKSLLNIFSIIGIIGGAIFMGIFFGIFYDTLKYDYTLANDCEISRINMVEYGGNYIKFYLIYKNILI